MNKPSVGKWTHWSLRSLKARWAFLFCSARLLWLSWRPPDFGDPSNGSMSWPLSEGSPCGGGGGGCAYSGGAYWYIGGWPMPGGMSAWGGGSIWPRCMPGGGGWGWGGGGADGGVLRLRDWRVVWGCWCWAGCEEEGVAGCGSSRRRMTGVGASDGCCCGYWSMTGRMTMIDSRRGASISKKKRGPLTIVVPCLATIHLSAVYSHYVIFACI